MIGALYEQPLECTEGEPVARSTASELATAGTPTTEDEWFTNPPAGLKAWRTLDKGAEIVRTCHGTMPPCGAERYPSSYGVDRKVYIEDLRPTGTMTTKDQHTALCDPTTLRTTFRERVDLGRLEDLWKDPGFADVDVYNGKEAQYESVREDTGGEEYAIGFHGIKGMDV